MKTLADIARKFRDAFKYDPGHSDLDREQPIHITVTLGDWRDLNYLLNAPAPEATAPTDCREAFDKAGYWPNEVMWKAWQQAWQAALSTVQKDVARYRWLRSSPVAIRKLAILSDDALDAAIDSEIDAGSRPQRLPTPEDKP